MFTDAEDVALSEVLTRVHQRQAGALFADDLLKDGEALRSAFAEVLPSYDRDRVYTSDIKKLFTWYNILVSANITTFTEEEEPKDN